MPTGLAVLQPGLFTTVQDHGRTGYRAFGVSPGGAFDRGSADLANALLGNPTGAAVVEMTLVGGTFEALGPLALALTGAPLSATVRSRDGRETRLRGPLCFPLVDGDRLILGGTTSGARTYLAVGGGWQTAVVLGSRSSESPIKAGDVLPCDTGQTPVRHPDPELDPFASALNAPLRVIDGPDAGLLDRDRLDGRDVFRVGPRSDRMGLRLEGPAWDVAAEPDRVSTPAAAGAVQVAGGQPLVLGVACGTMGGYPHVAHIVSADLDRLAQARPGDPLRFARVTAGEARRLDREARSARDARLSRVGAAAIDRPR